MYIVAFGVLSVRNKNELFRLYLLYRRPYVLHAAIVNPSEGVPGHRLLLLQRQSDCRMKKRVKNRPFERRARDTSHRVILRSIGVFEIK